MRILVLVSQFPYPAFSGAQLRTAGLIRGAVEAGYEIEIFSFAKMPIVETPFNDITENVMLVPPPERTTKERIKDLILTRRADMSRRFWSDAALNMIMKRLAQGGIDVVHAENMEMTPYLVPIHEKYPDMPLIYGSHNAEANLQKSIYLTERNNIRSLRGLIGTVYSFIQWRRLTRYESHIADISAHVLAVSEEDKRVLGKLSDTPITVVKNGVYVSDYANLNDDHDLAERAIVFTGTMDYRPNVDAVLWFASEIFPEILKHHPTAHFYIVGHRPHHRLLPLANHPNITITGKVDSIDPYMQGACVYVAPLRMGSGTRFKLLQAMSAKRAVVSTELGAMGLGVTNSKEMIIADDVQGFAQGVCDLLHSESMRQDMTSNAFDFVNEYFDWSVIIPHLVQVYDSLS